MNVQQYPLNKGQYFPDLTAKKFVVWHGTAGRTMHTPVSGRPGKATTSIDGWNLSADRVGAPWLVDRDGTIYETFNDAGWIYHLGLKGTKGQYDKQSVAIEFANEGPLDLDGDRLYAFDKITPNTVYNGPFIQYDWRGFNFFAQLDEPQVDAGIELTLDICRVTRSSPSSTARPRRTTSRDASKSRRSSVTPTAAPTRRTSACRSGCSGRSKRPGSVSHRDGAPSWTRSFGCSNSRSATSRLHAVARAARRYASIFAARSLASTSCTTCSAPSVPMRRRTPASHRATTLPLSNG